MRVSKRTELEAAMGPLDGIRIVELAGIGPGPFCAMLLSDMGAEVIRVGDFGGGALDLAMGVLAGIISARSTGRGQVIDCSMVEGSASLMMMMYGALASGAWNEERGANRTDGGAHYYHVYETRDGEHVAIGAIEPQFYALLLKHTGLESESLPPQTDRSAWPDMQQR